MYSRPFLRKVIQDSVGENFIDAVSRWYYFKKKLYAQGSCCKELPRGENNVLKACDFAMSQEDGDAYSSSDLKNSHKMDSTRSSRLREIVFKE